MRIGDIELHALSDGFFGLDGGAMFGVVPRVLWQKGNPPDRNNRILLALRPALIISGEERIVVDTGVGSKYGRRFDEMFNVDHSDDLVSSLRRHGLEPEEVTTVVMTHLHFDHAGGATRLDPGGAPVPTFPRARHVIQQLEWNDAVNPNRRTRGSYRTDDFLPLQQSGLVELVDGDVTVTSGVRVLRTGGHTRGHQLVVVESDGQTAVYWGDLIPTTSHVEIPYIMGYDLFPLDTMGQKEELVARAAQERWTCLFEHDPKVAFGRIVEQDGRFAVEPAE